jgi:hypothetical protein
MRCSWVACLFVPVTVRIDQDELDRVARLSRHTLAPRGTFWSGQAERFLASLWAEGRIPEKGQLTVTDLSRDDIDAAAVWEGD